MNRGRAHLEQKMTKDCRCRCRCRAPTTFMFWVSFSRIETIAIKPITIETLTEQLNQ